ncbi:antibiotic biosynthesis monooxygenase [Chitinophaga sp. GbtcB8]|uniref:antibiotic biosynthesis monooxygenase family protein n=1 Tax=Chitinophaga sp. GbtcB8 TaxID=2824753 RepID=UPI00211175CC|nr:antibiotic biosynthesis monooxygenase [Chitinophaga sp. GbtcB8]
MISRQWTGITPEEKAPVYIAHLQNDTFPKLSSMKGFIKASILKRKVPEGVEFMIITEWESLEAIQQFAGADPEVAVVPQTVQEIMIRYDKAVKHYEIAG